MHLVSQIFFVTLRIQSDTKREIGGQIAQEWHFMVLRGA